MAKAIYDIQLMDALTGASIITAGGKVLVATVNDTTKATLLNADTGASLTNPLTPTRGKIRFAIDSVSPLESVVDIYGISPSGHAFVVRDVKPGTPTEIRIDTGNRNQVLVIPFAIGDTTATTETDTGFDLPTGAMVLPFPAIYVTAEDATETIDVGLLSTESGGDANGFLALLSVATPGMVSGQATGTATLGALMLESITADAGTASVRDTYVVGATAVSVSYTLTAGTNTAEGFIHLPYVLPPTM